MTGAENGITRRELLVGANALALISLLEACTGGGGRSGSSASTGSDVIADTPVAHVLELLREAVRLSPDHLASRAAEVVAAGKADAIVAFVRDSIGVVPPWSRGADVLSSRRWGSDACLRGAQGSLRDRAELLVELLGRAGFEAKVVTARRPDAIDLAALYKQPVLTFTPDEGKLTEAMQAAKDAGIGVPSPPSPVTPAPDPTNAILDALGATLQRAVLRDDLLPDTVPLVSYNDGGVTKYAFALGHLDPTGDAPAGLRDSDAAQPFDRVVVTVSGLASPPPGSLTPRGVPVDVVKAEWTADQIVGRSAVLTFVSPEGPKATASSPLASQPVRVPLLHIQSTEPPPSEPPAADATALPTAVAGALITVQGDVLAAPEGSTGATAPVGPFGPLTVLSDDERKAAAGTVATVTVEAIATAFPDVELSINARDGNDRAVEGLDAPAFTITEDGQPVGFQLTANAVSSTKPRVLIAYDVSGSVSAVWPSPEAKAAFEDSLGATLASAAKATAFDVQVVGLGSDPTLDGWVPADGPTIAAGLRAAGGLSDIWVTLAGKAIDQGAVAILLVSDVDSNEDPAVIAAAKTRVALAHVPVVVLPIGNPVEAAIAEVLSLTGGTRIAPLEATAPDQIAAVIAPLVAKAAATTYRLRYTAPIDGAATRTVTVGLSAANPTGEASYTVPAAPAAPPSFVGLYVTIQIGGLTQRRRLAGVALSDRGSPLDDLTDPAFATATRGVIDGITTIVIEPGTPTAASVLDDVLGAQLSIEPLRPIWPNGSVDDVLDTASKLGVHRLPALFALALQRAQDAQDDEALTGLRVAILQERAGTAQLEQHLDLAPGLNPIVAASTDPTRAFRAAVAASVAHSRAEGDTSDVSAFHLLTGQSFTTIASFDSTASGAYLDTVPAASKRAWTNLLQIYGDRHVLVVTGGAVGAAWVIDPASGATTAVLLDGTGGALALLSCDLTTLDELNLVLGILGLLCTFGLVTSPFFCIGITVLAVGLTVVILFNEPIDERTPFGVFSTVFGATASIGAKAAPGAGIVVIILLLVSLECFD